MGGVALLAGQGQLMTSVLTNSINVSADAVWSHGLPDVIRQSVVVCELIHAATVTENVQFRLTHCRFIQNVVEEIVFSELQSEPESGLLSKLFHKQVICFSTLEHNNEDSQRKEKRKTSTAKEE